MFMVIDSNLDDAIVNTSDKKMMVNIVAVETLMGRDE
jgi:hypothetical protein